MEKNDIIFEAVVINAYYGSDKYDKEDKYRLVVKSDDIPYTEITVFDESGSRFTPTWLKEANGFMNLKSNYDIPVKNSMGREINFSEWLETGTAKGSVIKLKIRQKYSRGNGAVYPVAVRVITPGIAEDPFEDM